MRRTTAGRARRATGIGVLRFGLLCGVPFFAACTGSASEGGAGSTGNPDGGPQTVSILPGVDGGVLADAGSDGAVVIDAGPSPPPPLPPPPPADDARVAHVLVERAGQLFVARVAPDGRYVGPVADALPVVPDDLGEVPPVLWARDEGPRVVVDLGEAGVFAGEGGAWRSLGERPVADDVRRFLEVSSDVERVLLGYSALDMLTFQYNVTGDVWSTAGEAIYTRLPGFEYVNRLGIFSADGSLFAMHVPMGVEVHRSDDGSLNAMVPAYQDVQAVFPTSLIVGQRPYLSWIDFQGLPVMPMELLSVMSWQLSPIGGEPHTVISGMLYRLDDRELVPVRAVQMSAASILGYVEGGALVGEISETTGDGGPPDRAFVVLAEDATEMERFAPEASVVEADGSVENAEWERRARAKAWVIGADRSAVLFEVQHTYWRGAYGQIAAVSDDLWVIDDAGARSFRVSQRPYRPGAAPALSAQRRFTEDGAWYVWTDGDGVQALSTESFEVGELIDAF